MCEGIVELIEVAALPGIAGADLASDLIVLWNGYPRLLSCYDGTYRDAKSGEDTHEYCTNDWVTRIMFEAGFWLFIIGYPLARLSVETYCCGAPNIKVLRAVCYGLCFGPFIVLERFMRLALLPLDPLLSIGFCCAAPSNRTGNWVIADYCYFFTHRDKDFLAGKWVVEKWFYILLGFTSGGRWISSLWRKIGKEETIPLRHGEDSRQIRYIAKRISQIALVEELLENSGGAAMSLSVLLEGGGRDEKVFGLLTQRQFAIASLAIAGISAVIETGWLFGNYLFFKNEQISTGRSPSKNT